jgi:hypothetical protein
MSVSGSERSGCGSVYVFLTLVRSLPALCRCRGMLCLITHQDAQHSVGLLWRSDRPVAETSTWQHTTLKTDGHPCHRRVWNPQSLQADSRRPTPYTARPPESAKDIYYGIKTGSPPWYLRLRVLSTRTFFSQRKSAERSYPFGAIHCLQAQRGRSWWSWRNMANLSALSFFP